ncbi:MAG TPA: class A beta-lactamase [Candidatus Nesterenkonia stercoripullorum]|uniref:Beta-lactamase n=1 Tax=Candidatus Nesterenkonia stercoripullorum TaxID=2838701 RepID=A0A9D1UU08_9MICC|nr:class A beta-lactamase [Candidatus Nesterenkonia stercoripullorum]
MTDFHTSFSGGTAQVRQHSGARSPRRRCLATVATSLALVLGACSSDSPEAESPSTAAEAEESEGSPDLQEQFDELESRFDARLGVYAVDTASGDAVEWRAEDRFAYASTIKAMAAGALLDDVGIEGLDREVTIDSDDIIAHSPVTEQHTGEAMTLAELSEAAMVISDNAAANYLFDALGGVSSLGTSLEELGDEVTSVARDEPDLNEAAPGDERDTTTPRAFGENLQEFAFGDTLSAQEQELFTGWLKDTETGDTLVRADLPDDWTVGDKSGSAGYGTRNDIAVVWPDEGGPLVVSVFSDLGDDDAEADDRLIAEAAELAVSDLR